MRHSFSLKAKIRLFFFSLWSEKKCFFSLCSHASETLQKTKIMKAKQKELSKNLLFQWKFECHLQLLEETSLTYSSPGSMCHITNCLLPVAAKVCDKRAAAPSTLNRVCRRGGGEGGVGVREGWGAGEGMGGGVGVGCGGRGDEQSRLINILSQHTVQCTSKWEAYKLNRLYMYVNTQIQQLMFNQKLMKRNKAKNWMQK